MINSCISKNKLISYFFNESPNQSDLKQKFIFHSCCLSVLGELLYFILSLGLPRWFHGKESSYQCKSHRRLRFNAQVGRTPWRRKWQPMPGFLSGESHGQRSLVTYSPWGHKELNMTEVTAHSLRVACCWRGHLLKGLPQKEEKNTTNNVSVLKGFCSRITHATSAYTAFPKCSHVHACRHKG